MAVSSFFSCACSAVMTWASPFMGTSWWGYKPRSLTPNSGFGGGGCPRFVDVRQGVGRAAFGPDGAGAAFALATLGGHAVFLLDGVEVKTHARALGDGFVADTVANADDHGVAGCLLCE